MFRPPASTTLGDYLQSLPANSGAVNAITEGASFTRGATTLNLRGLGGNRFLTLLNGRRVAPYALTNSNQALVFDFNSLPPERPLSPSNSSRRALPPVYGSDAVTGVLNIRLRPVTFEGLEVGLTLGNTDGHDMMFRSVNATVGNRHRSDLHDGRGVPIRIPTVASFPTTAARSRTGLFGPRSPRARNNNSGFNFPANVNLSAAQAEAAGLPGPGFYATINPAGVANPSVDDFRAGFNLFEFAPFIQFVSGLQIHVDVLLRAP